MVSILRIDYPALSCKSRNCNGWDLSSTHRYFSVSMPSEFPVMQLENLLF